MEGFYARYVPPGRSAEKTETHDRISPKRKHEDDQQNFAASHKRPKIETGNSPDRNVQRQSDSSIKKSRRCDLNPSEVIEEKVNVQLKTPHDSKPKSQAEKVLAKYSSIKAAKRPNSGYVSGHENGGGEAAVANSDPQSVRSLRAYEGKSRKAKKDATLDEAIATGDGDQSAHHAKEAQTINSMKDQKHAGVRQKFETSKAKGKLSASSRDPNDEGRRGHDQLGDTSGKHVPVVELHGLEPLPHPLQPKPSSELPTYSALPGWMAMPLQVQLSSTTDFKDLNLDQRLVSNLHAKGIAKAFAVQAAVLPLLLEGKSNHRGDICISAATGSGKTLAYILPMCQALLELAGTKLRGLVVVPTRELVAQAREVCELCAAGTGLRIATALGSKALKDEQSALIEQHMLYDPEQYKMEREQPIDWTHFGLENILAHSEEGNPTTNYVKSFSSRADILITTPGRLVDHLRSTPGFNLDDVQWVVVDEADRLLNESFQEWIEVVRPALKSDAATRSRDELLRELRLDIPERKVQKVILSATMTQDISKLNSLDLQNPKLVVVGNLPKPQPAHENAVTVEDTEPVLDANGTFSLPPTLAEFAVSVGDGSEKPLYLIELLNTHIFKHPEQQNGLHASSTKVASMKTSSNIPNGTALESSHTSSSGSSDTADSDCSVDASNSTSLSGTPPPTIHQSQTVLIFTRSTEAATRLSRLLSILSPSLAPRIGVLSRSSNSSSSRKTLSQFRQGKTTLLVATDRASRGLDLSGLAHVVSYDVPTSVTTYIHRVGRTARAGREGKAWTLIGHREARWFWNEIGKSKEAGTVEEVRVGRGDRKVKRVNIEIGREGDKEELRKRYEDGLRMLGEEVRRNS